MKYVVAYSEQANKALRKMNKSVAATIISWIDKNLDGTSNPYIHGKALTGNLAGYWRYRVGDYRILADIQNDTLIIYIVLVGHRRDIYDS